MNVTPHCVNIDFSRLGSSVAQTLCTMNQTGEKGIMAIQMLNIHPSPKNNALKTKMLGWLSRSWNRHFFDFVLFQDKGLCLWYRPASGVLVSVFRKEDYVRCKRCGKTLQLVIHLIQSKQTSVAEGNDAHGLASLGPDLSLTGMACIHLMIYSPSMTV